MTKSQTRVLRRNTDLTRRSTSPWATEEQYTLFRSYLDNRHADGGMADMDIFEFAAMIEETPIRSRVIEYTSSPSAGNRRGPLSAVCLTDVLDDGLSMVYSFYDLAREKLSMGTYVILDHIRIAQEAGLPYVYLGYWVPGSPKMGYKAKFGGLEVYKHGRWIAVGNPEDHRSDPHPLMVDPIAEQVARISLPDTMSAKG